VLSEATVLRLASEEVDATELEAEEVESCRLVGGEGSIDCEEEGKVVLLRGEGMIVRGEEEVWVISWHGEGEGARRW
jgi:hypothetical protein